MNTNADRRIALATPAAGGWNAWLTSELTARADSPSVSLTLSNPDQAALAFLVRGKDEDGQTDTGMLSNQATIIKIGRDPILPVGMNAQPLIAELEAQGTQRFTWRGLSNNVSSTNTLDVLTILPDADPALDPLLSLSQAHADPGSPVIVNATLRNLGRNPSGELTVSFYRGQPGSGILIESLPAASLDFNESQQVSLELTAGSGAQPLYAEVTSLGENANPGNDLATGDLGEMPAAVALGVIESPTYESSLAVKWQPLDLPGIAGYRVLRGTQPGGPYELVGEATQPVFNDMPVLRGQQYYYVVLSFDQNGVLSAYSNEVSGRLPNLSIFLPLLKR